MDELNYQNLNSILQNVERHIEKKEYSEALELLNQSIENNPRNVKLLCRRASVYGSLRDFKSAFNDLENAEKIHPIEDVFYTRTLLFASLGNIEDAWNQYNKCTEYIDDWYKLKFLRNIIELQMKNFNIYSSKIRKGISAASESQTELAINILNEAIEIMPFREEGYANLANAYDDLGEYEKAILTYDKCIEINPQNPNHYFNLALIYSNLLNNSNIFDLDNFVSPSDCIENSNARMLMAAYLGDEQAKNVCQTIDIVYQSSDGQIRRKPILSSKQKILEDILYIAEYKLALGSLRDAKKIFNFVLTVDKSNSRALDGIFECDSELDD